MTYHWLKASGKWKAFKNMSYSCDMSLFRCDPLHWRLAQYTLRDLWKEKCSLPLGYLRNTLQIRVLGMMLTTSYLDALFYQELIWYFMHWRNATAARFNIQCVRIRNHIEYNIKFWNRSHLKNPHLVIGRKV